MKIYLLISSVVLPLSSFVREGKGKDKNNDLLGVGEGKAPLG